MVDVSGIESTSPPSTGLFPWAGKRFPPPERDQVARDVAVTLPPDRHVKGEAVQVERARSPAHLLVALSVAAAADHQKRDTVATPAGDERPGKLLEAWREGLQMHQGIVTGD